MYTIDEIRAMSPEERKQLNKILARRLVRNTVIGLSVGVAVVLGAALISGKLNSDDADITA